LKPKRSEVHPRVEDDIAALLKGSRATRDSAARGWALVHDGWLKDGLPPELSAPVARLHGFELTVLDAFRCTLVFGWRASDRRLVLFAMVPMAADQSAAQIIDRFKDRIEGSR
jgi:hypothetical protein